jgi:predicted transcriptional regulator
MAESIDELQAFACLAQSTRYAIVLTLLLSGTRDVHRMSFSALMRHLKLDSSLLDHHLTMLNKAGLVRNVKQWLEPEKKKSIRKLVGLTAYPGVINLVTQTKKEYSYYQPTKLCRAIVRKLQVNTEDKMQLALSQALKSKDYQADIGKSDKK